MTAKTERTASPDRVHLQSRKDARKAQKRDNAGKTSAPLPKRAKPASDVGDVPAHEATFSIFVRPTWGRTFIMGVASTTTIAQLKWAIDRKTTIPSAEQRLSYSRWELADWRDLAYYDITNYVTIWLNVRFRGGSDDNDHYSDQGDHDNDGVDGTHPYTLSLDDLLPPRPNDAQPGSHCEIPMLANSVGALQTAVNHIEMHRDFSDAPLHPIARMAVDVTGPPMLYAAKCFSTSTPMGQAAPTMPAGLFRP